MISSLMIEPLVRAALLEDLGRAGDITTEAVVPAQARAETELVARQPGVIAGLDVAALQEGKAAIKERIDHGSSQIAAATSSATSSGWRATLTPASLSAAILSLALPVPPLIIAPACPIRLPSGAV